MRRARVAIIGVVMAALLTAAYLVGGATHPAKSADAGGSVPMVVAKGPGGQVAALVGVTIGSRELPFIVDTGAAGSLIDRRVARRLHLPVVSGRHQVAGIGGRARAVTVAVPRWAVGPVALPPSFHLDASALKGSRGGGPVGLLGSDLLSRFARITLDYRHRRLTLGR